MAESCLTNDLSLLILILWQSGHLLRPSFLRKGTVECGYNLGQEYRKTQIDPEIEQLKALPGASPITSPSARPTRSLRLVSNAKGQLRLVLNFISISGVFYKWHLLLHTLSVRFIHVPVICSFSSCIEFLHSSLKVVFGKPAYYSTQNFVSCYRSYFKFLLNTFPSFKKKLSPSDDFNKGPKPALMNLFSLVSALLCKIVTERPCIVRDFVKVRKCIK